VPQRTQPTSIRPLPIRAFARSSPRSAATTRSPSPHIDTDVLAANPKPFLGYSDSTNLHNLLWSLGIPSYYGGSTQVHLGTGPRIDEVHLISLRAALLDGGEMELTEPGESEDFGISWTDDRALTEFGVREKTDPWTWAGPTLVAEGRTWGGCIEVIDQIALAGRMPHVEDVAGAILLLETSEETPSAHEVKRWVRALGERGILQAIAGVLVARPPVSDLYSPVPAAEERARRSSPVEWCNRFVILQGCGG